MYIQDLSKEVGLSKKAINLYESKGFIQPQKDNMGYRNYTEKEIMVLHKVKQLRNLGFTLSQIHDVLIDQNYEVFEQKREEYLKQYYELDTSIQYIEDVKEMIKGHKEIDSLSKEMDKIFELKNIKAKYQETIDFDAYMLPIMIFCFVGVLSETSDNLLTISLTLVFLLATSLSSVYVQTFIYKIINKLKKKFDRP